MFTFGIKNGSAENVNKNSSKNLKSSDSRSCPVGNESDCTMAVGVN